MPSQPLITTIQSADEKVPVVEEPLDYGDLPSISQIAPGNIGGFAREAQAAYLLDRVFVAMKFIDGTSQSSELSIVDAELQSLISVVMNQSVKGVLCGAIAIAIR